MTEMGVDAVFRVVSIQPVVKVDESVNTIHNPRSDIEAIYKRKFIHIRGSIQDTIVLQRNYDHFVKM